MTNILGLDIGGANTKAAHSNGVCRSFAFPLWKTPERLADVLADLFASMPPHERLAVTMTGELCDCFETKRAGVSAILHAVELAAEAPISVWTLDGRFVTPAEARDAPLSVAAANWLALATFAGRCAGDGPALLIDIGSTTTDMIPLQDGIPTPKGRTDPERLQTGELVYTGVRRTPMCALLGPDGIAAEFFATTRDVYLMLNQIAEDHDAHDTADGRPATKRDAARRIARMVCGDEETCSRETIDGLAREAHNRQLGLLESALTKVAGTLPSEPQTVIVSGSGEFLAKELLQRQPFAAAQIISLRSELGIEQSQAACALAVANLC